MNNDQIAAITEAAARIADLQNALERMREEREAARSSVDLLMHENAQLEAKLAAATATVDRLRIHLQQGIEL